MNLNEIETFLLVSDTKSVCVDRCLSDIYPGFVRDVTICSDNIVRIEFDVYGYDEGGLTFKITFKSLKLLVSSLEQYLCKNIKSWENFNKTGWYPELGQTIDFDESGRKLKYDLANKKIQLPLNGEKYIIPNGYWKDLADGKIKE